jgi:hypothetical protein
MEENTGMLPAGNETVVRVFTGTLVVPHLMRIFDGNRAHPLVARPELVRLIAVAVDGGPKKSCGLLKVSFAEKSDTWLALVVGVDPCTGRIRKLFTPLNIGSRAIKLLSISPCDTSIGSVVCGMFGLYAIILLCNF